MPWKKIKAEYIRGGTTYRKLAEKYGVSFSSVRRRAEAEKWRDLRTKSEQKASAKIVNSVANQKAKQADKVQSLADKLLEKIEEKIDTDEFLLESKDVRAITAALKDLKDIKGYKSELEIQEQMARIEKLRKEARPEEDTHDVSVVMSSTLDDYAG